MEIEKPKRVMLVRRSKNKCPWCGEREWNCYFACPQNQEHRGAEEAVRSYSLLIDNNEQTMINEARRVDECAYCGAVVS